MSASLLTGKAQGERLELVASGAWTADNAARLESLVDQYAGQALAGPGGKTAGRASIDRASIDKVSIDKVSINMGAVEKLDTYGARLLERLTQVLDKNGLRAQVLGLPEKFSALAETVHRSSAELPLPPLRHHSVSYWLDRLGRNTAEIWRSGLLIAQMLGETTLSFLRALLRPHRFRWTSMVNQIDIVGWRAVPIIFLITFLIGGILAQQGIFHFRRFGADIFVVDMVGIMVLREIGVLIVCVMVAGRSGSAYTAELGAMKMREEIDALRTMGFDPVDILILPRILALVIAVPLLTFIGMLAALYGAGLVSSLYGGISPEVFLQRLREAISTDHFMVGMIKAPFMALIIGIIACVEGLRTRGSAESLGRHTTAAVVKSIFIVIVLDGLFAIFFAAIDM